MSTLRQYRLNVFLLAAANGLALTAAITGITFGGLVGQMLAENKALVTLPVAMMTVGTALVTVPASFLMRRVGRKTGFMVGALFGVGYGVLGAYAIYLEDFILFSAASLLQGGYQAFSQYYRFAATETAPKEYIARAVSLVLAGGVAAALIAPSLSVWSSTLLDPVPFAGAYVAVACVSLLAFIPLALIRIPHNVVEDHGDHEDSAARPMGQIIRQPVFIAAVLNACAGYGLMVLVMTATPLAMVACSFTITDASQVIQWHVLAMFLPSFVTGSLIKRFGVLPILYTGMVLFALSASSALNGIALSNFTLALVFLGVGWNFLFVGGTTLLTEAYRPSEKAKVQGINEFLVFASAASASFSSGGLLSWSGWDAVNMGTYPLLVVTFMVTGWYALSERRRRRMAATA